MKSDAAKKIVDELESKLKILQADFDKANKKKDDLVRQ